MKNRKILSYLIVLLFLLLFSSSSLFIMNVQGAFYSDNLSAGTELKWKLSIEDVVPIEDIDQYRLNITATESLSDGDTFKIVLAKDPDLLGAPGLDGIFDTSDYWADFYINNIHIGNDSTELLVSRDFSPSNGPEIIFIYILPTHFDVEKTSRIIQEHLKEGYENYEESNSTYLYEISINSKNFYMKSFITVYENATDTTYEYTTEVIYNIKWGVLAKLDSLMTAKNSISNTTAHILLESTKTGIKVSYEWIIGFLAIILSGIVVRSRRKGKIKIE